MYDTSGVCGIGGLYVVCVCVWRELVFGSLLECLCIAPLV